jgi:hypothetical protein
VLVAPHLLEPAAARGREARRLGGDRERALELVEVVVDAARGRERTVGAQRIAARERLRGLLERAPELAEDALRDLADERDRVRRQQERRDGEADAAADQRLEHAVGRVAVARRLERREQDRRDRRLVDQQLAAAEDDRGAHREHDEQADLERAGADREQQHARDRDAEHDAAEQLERAPAALAVGDAEADDRGDAREDRPRRRQQREREPPCRERGRGGLEHRQRVRAQPPARRAGDRSGGACGERAHGHP